MAVAKPLDSLNVAQRRAATYGELLPDAKGVRAGPLLVIAGAGTGKTNTIAHRVAHLAINGADPGRILLLTFTRRAAQEMRRRVHDIVRAALDDTLGNRAQAVLQRLTWAGTFHSVGNRLLRHYARHLQLDPTFSVLDRSDAADLFDAVRTDLDHAAKDQRFPRKDALLAIYSWRVNTQRSLREALEQQFPWCLHWEEEIKQICREYVARKQKLLLLDYDDLLLYWHTMMSEPRLAQHLSSNFDHVLVDEFQDTNKLQGDILYALKPDGAGVTAVGDDAQSIYSFRAASVENILSFPDRYQPRAEVITLAQNYRSTQPVLDAANALMSEAQRQFRKHLLAVRGGGARPLYVSTDDLQSQAEYVAQQVLRRRETGVPLRRQAVLFRNGSASDVLEVELVRRNIPFVKYGGLKFLEAAHVKDMLSVLRWADNPRHALAGSRVLQLLPGLGPVHAKKLLELLANGGGSIGLLAGAPAPSTARVAIPHLVELMETLADSARAWAGQVHLVREWYQPHMERIYEHVHTRVGDLDQLEQLSVQYPTRERFLTELALDPPNAAGDLAGAPLHDEDFLILSTVHSAKGMEWDTVYVLNLVDGSFPSEFATGRPEMVEEERRLLNVAITRARQELQLIAPLKFLLTQQPRDGDAHVYGARSRFVTDKFLKCFEQASFQGLQYKEASLSTTSTETINVAGKLQEMW